MFAKALLTLFAFSSLLAVHAQSGTSAAIPTSTSSIPTCVLTCTGTAASQSGCNGVGDLGCVCTSQAFQSAARQCLQSSCSPQDQATANALQSALCASVSGSSGSGTAPATSGSNTASSTAPATSSGSGAASTTSGAASSGQSSAPTTSATSSPGSGVGSSVSNGASSVTSNPAAASTSNAASAISFGLGAAHVFGAVGVAVGLVAGAGALL